MFTFYATVVRDPGTHLRLFYGFGPALGVASQGALDAAFVKVYGPSYIFMNRHRGCACEITPWRAARHPDIPAVTEGVLDVSRLTPIEALRNPAKLTRSAEERVGVQ